MGSTLRQDSDDGLDTTVLPDLLARIGAGVAGDLHRQLDADLRGLRQTLGTAIGPPSDLVAMARQAHVLVALAGMAGGHDLARRARVLVRRAQLGDGAASVRLVSDMLPRIDALLRFIAACPLPAGIRP